jgi:hypothetical protein
MSCMCDYVSLHNLNNIFVDDLRFTHFIRKFFSCLLLMWMLNLAMNLKKKTCREWEQCLDMNWFVEGKNALFIFHSQIFMLRHSLSIFHFLHSFIHGFNVSQWNCKFNLPSYQNLTHTKLIGILKGKVFA